VFAQLLRENAVSKLAQQEATLKGWVQQAERNLGSRVGCWPGGRKAGAAAKAVGLAGPAAIGRVVRIRGTGTQAGSETARFLLSTAMPAACSGEGARAPAQSGRNRTSPASAAPVGRRPGIVGRTPVAPGSSARRPKHFDPSNPAANDILSRAVDRRLPLETGLALKAAAIRPAHAGTAPSRPAVQAGPAPLPTRPCSPAPGKASWPRPAPPSTTSRRPAL